MQREMALLAEMTTELREIEARIVALCRSEQEAYRLCVSQSRTHYTMEVLAVRLGVDCSHLKQMLNSDRAKKPKYMPRHLQEDLQLVCGNKAISQWGDLYRQGLLQCQRTTADLEAELLAQLAALRSGQGAR